MFSTCSLHLQTKSILTIKQNFGLQDIKATCFIRLQLPIKDSQDLCRLGNAEYFKSHCISTASGSSFLFLYDTTQRSICFRGIYGIYNPFSQLSQLFMQETNHLPKQQIRLKDRRSLMPSHRRLAPIRLLHFCWSCRLMKKKSPLSNLLLPQTL